MRHIVTPAENGKRLRDILRGSMHMSYTALKQAKWNGQILVNDQPRTVDRTVQTGDRILVMLPDAQPVFKPQPFEYAIPVLYEDDHLMIINKPAPMPSQSSAKQPANTLQNALCWMSGDPDHFIYRPVNRLDKGTSGLMAVAKNAHAQHLLQQLLHTANFQRTYLAVVSGTPDEPAGIIDLPIAKEDAASVRRVISDVGKPSATEYTVLKPGERCLVRLLLQTGRTHQIRVHMSAIGHPVFGDFLYGEQSPLLPGRFALHSSEISLVHPITGETLHITAPLPDELSDLL